MHIIHKKGAFLYTIFPQLRGGSEDQIIIDTLETYYTYGPYKPKITIENEWITIEIDTPTIFSQQADYKKIVALSEKGKYSEAKPILKRLIEKNPTNSEYHRIMGQIFSEEGDQEEAINSLIDALRWDARNGWALLMMGNIFAKFKNDIPTALKYYDQALIANPNDYIVINNIAANLMQQGKIVEAKKYFQEALQINDQYPNTHLALGMIAEMENDFHSAFANSILAIKFNKSKDALYENSVRKAIEIAKKITETGRGKEIFNEYKHKLEFDGGVEIAIFEDTEISTAAKIEFAEYYNRPKHIIKFKPSYPAVEHLIMHELVHLDFVIEARKVDSNQAFIATDEQRTNFLKTLQPSVLKLRKMGVSEEAIDKYCRGLFDGLNLQVYNAPIDLLIESFLYNQYSELRPYQFLSLHGMIQEGLKAVTDKKTIELSPGDILSKSKIYNLVNAVQFKELFGLDSLQDFNATTIELKQARKFYEEYLEYKDDKKPGEEYELVLHWAEDLKLDKNFELVDEVAFRTKRTDIDNLLSSIENDPFDLESKDPYKEREMEKFQKSQKSIGTNMAVVMFMVEALKFFENKPLEEIKKIAFEIAMQGSYGYRPEKKDYRINSIGDKTFSGYHILAYYYVSWMLAIPEMVDQLNLPYETEYKVAISMYKQK